MKYALQYKLLFHKKINQITGTHILVVSLSGISPLTTFFMLSHSEQQFLVTGCYYALSAIPFFIVFKLLKLEKTEINRAALFIAHEVKSPMSTVSMLASTVYHIMSNAPVIEHKDESNSTITMNNDDWKMLQNSVNYMNKSSKVGIRIIEAILYGYKEEYYDIGRYSLASCIKHIISSYHYLTAEEIKLIIFKDKPGKDINFYGSSAAMKCVIANLVSNILKHSSNHEGIDIWIDGLHMFIRASSKNMTPAAAKTLELSYQNQNSVELHYSKRIMQLLGGSIDCECTSDGYISFVLTFPDHDC